VPGLYTVRLGNGATWKNTAKGDLRSCNQLRRFPPPEIVLRIEPLGDALVIDGADHGPPHAQGFARGSVKRSGDCDASVALVTEVLQLDAKLTFDGDRITGSTSATYQIVEGDDEHENIWSCETASVPITGKPVER